MKFSKKTLANCYTCILIFQYLIIEVFYSGLFDFFTFLINTEKLLENIGKNHGYVLTISKNNGSTNLKFLPSIYFSIINIFLFKK